MFGINRPMRLFILLLLFVLTALPMRTEALSVVYLDDQGKVVAPPRDFRQRIQLLRKHWWSDKTPSDLSQESLEGEGFRVQLVSHPDFGKSSPQETWRTVSKATGTVIDIVSGDEAGEGFNDTTPKSPVGGNSGKTLGEQRLIAFQRAAEIWADHLISPVEITVQAQFDPLTCGPNSGILGSAGPEDVVRDFPGAPATQTWYTVAQGNSLAGYDLIANSPDISATFNSLLDNNDGCLGTTDWYYGLDGKTGEDIDLLSVLIHEFAHGLGFVTLVSQTGQRFLGYNDGFMLHLMDASLGLTWNVMNVSQRADSAVDTGDLVWNGIEVTAAAVGLTNGTHSTGKVEMYAPSPYDPGSSVSHFSKDVTPSDVMEPSYTGVHHDPGLAFPLMKDLGWMVPAISIAPSPTFSSTPVPAAPTATLGPVATSTPTPSTTSTPTRTPNTNPGETATWTPTRTVTPVFTVIRFPTPTSTFPPKVTPARTPSPTPSRQDPPTLIGPVELLNLLSAERKGGVDWLELAIRWAP